MSTRLVPARGKRRSRVVQRRPTVSGSSFGRERFRFSLRREQRRLSTLNIDPFVESCNWTRDTGVRSGNLNFRRPLTGLQAAAIAQGDRIQCDVDLHGNGQWVRLWYMTVATPSHQIANGLIAVALKSGLKAAQESKAAFNLKDKDARQITLEVCRRFHLRVGYLPSARYKIPKIQQKSMSPYDIIVKAWKYEREHTGRHFDVDISRGLVDVTELRRPAYMLLIGKTVMDATLTQTLDRMASAVIVTSTRTVGGRKRKLRVKVVDHARVRRYGYIVKKINRPKLHSEAACRRAGHDWLARNAKPTGDVTFTHPGLPFLDRGDSMRLQLPDANLNQLVYVKGTTHAVSAGSYTMEVTVAVSDPWLADERTARAERKKAAKARERRRHGAPKRTKAPTPKKAARRSTG